MTPFEPTTRQGLLWLGIALVAAVVAGAAGFYMPGEGHEPIVSALYWTGRLAFLVFLIPLFAGPLRQLIRTDLTANLMRWGAKVGDAYPVGMLLRTLVLIQPSPTTQVAK